MNKIKILRVFIVVLIIGTIFIVEIIEFHSMKLYYLSDLNSKIITIEGNISGGRSYDYITKKGIIITLMNSDTLYVGDSIVKEKNNWVFELYRKNENGNYKFIRTYNLDK